VYCKASSPFFSNFLSFVLFSVRLWHETETIATSQVRFAWWGAGDIGLLGSKHYTSNLTDEERANHSLNLNFDMLASPNYIRGVYNGSGCAESSNQTKYACEQIQKVFEDGFDYNNLSYSIIQSTGSERSDHDSFIEPGIDIPAGALSTGADDIKTVEERATYGGLANAAMDTCYQQDCDTIDNIDTTVLDQMADVAAYALEELMFKKDLKSFLYNQKSKRSVNSYSRERLAIRRG
jgi:Zn-dependent M28 family amino/carboxypeptidase